tara:strand:+ start:43 stop:813 length:771 start_codon:yes stop_codon:yes gene_type:complete
MKDSFLLYTNDGASDMCLNCVYSLKKLGIDDEQILLYTADSASKDKLESYGLNVHSIGAETHENYQDWNTKGFHKVVHYKIKSIIDALQTSNVFYLDTDNVIFKNPLDFVSKVIESDSIDIMIQDDSDLGGRWKSLCTGVVYIRSNEKTLKFYDECMKLHAKNIENGQSTGDQASFNEIYARRGSIEGLQELTLGVLPMQYFPNGQAYFDNDIGKDEKYLVHNNYISGVESKIKRFITHDMWHLENPDFNKTMRRK